MLRKLMEYLRERKLVIAGFVFLAAVNLAIHVNLFVPQIINAEWNSATVLRHLQIWHQEGGMSYGFNPVVTYPDGANKYIDNHASTQVGFSVYEDKRGNYYYTSYPQFGYIAPYMFFKLFGSEPNIVGLRMFGLTVQLLTAIFIYKIALWITKQRLPAFFGALAYAFLQPVTLYYHSHSYMVDMLVPLLLTATVYFLLRITGGQNSKAHRVLFAVSLSAFVYTEYLGVIVSGAVFLFALFNRKEVYARFLLLVTFLASLLVTCLTIVQFASVGSLAAYLRVMLERYTGAYTGMTPPHAVQEILLGYFRWNVPTLIAIALLLALLGFIRLSIQQGHAEYQEEASRLSFVALFLLVPNILHHGMFLNWTGYHAQFFALLKTSPFIAICFAAATWYVLHRTLVYDRRVLIAFVFAAFVVGSVHAHGRYRSIVDAYDYPTSYCAAGLEIARTASPDEVIFVRDADVEQHDFPVDPVIVTCAKRNVAVFETEEKARELMRRNGAESAIVFTMRYVDGVGAVVVGYERGEGAFEEPEVFDTVES